jgi:prevent-host-death family protein
MAVTEKRVGIRELKARLSDCIREVKAGRTLIVTEHGAPVARMIPETTSVRARLEALRQTGNVAWSGRRLRRIKPPARVRGNRTVAGLVSDNRE